MLGVMSSGLVQFDQQEADDPATLVDRDPGFARAGAIANTGVKRFFLFECVDRNRDFRRHFHQERENVGGLAEFGMATGDLSHAISPPRPGLGRTSAASTAPPGPAAIRRAASWPLRCAIRSG